MPCRRWSHAWGSGAWPMVSALARLHNDQAVHFLVFDPEDKFFLAEFGHYGAFSVPASGTIDLYTAGIWTPPRGSDDRLAFAADVAAVFGDGGRWGIWAERDTAGVVVTDDPSRLWDWELEYGPYGAFLSAEDALESFVRLGFRGSVPQDFISKFKENYGLAAT